MLLTKSARFGPKQCLSRPASMQDPLFLGNNLAVTRLAYVFGIGTPGRQPLFSQSGQNILPINV